jgi:hypothetical protein
VDLEKLLAVLPKQIRCCSVKNCDT